MQHLDHHIILAPLITEKTNEGIRASNTVCFKVAKDANKVEIKQAVARLFQVKVERVNTVNMGGKAKQRGRQSGHMSNFKKAFVKLAAGQKIQLLEGLS